MAIWVMPLVGDAPCQCFSFGGIQTTSPGRISRTGPPLACTRPTPEITYRVWPKGCVCHAVRAPGSKATRVENKRASDYVALFGTCSSVSGKYCDDVGLVGR